MQCCDDLYHTTLIHVTLTIITIHKYIHTHTHTRFHSIHIFPLLSIPSYYNLCTIVFGRSFAWGAAANGPEVDARVRVRADELDTVVLPGERLQRLQQIDRHTCFAQNVTLARQIWYICNFDIVHVHVQDKF